MTLGELIANESLVGRTVELHDTNMYIYYGTVNATTEKDDMVRLALRDTTRAFDDGRGKGSPRIIPCFVAKFKATTPVQLCEETFTFTLPDGGRGYILPVGRKPPRPVKEAEDE